MTRSFVSNAEGECRSAPSKLAHATTRLFWGDSVHVVRQLAPIGSALLARWEGGDGRVIVSAVSEAMRSMAVSESNAGGVRLCHVSALLGVRDLTCLHMAWPWVGYGKCQACGAACASDQDAVSTRRMVSVESSVGVCRSDGGGFGAPIAIHRAALAAGAKATVGRAARQRMLAPRGKVRCMYS